MRRSPFVGLETRQQQPQYRFWGNQRPPAQRERVRAQVTPTGDGAGTATIRLYGPVDSWGDFWGVSATEFAEALDGLDSSVDTIQLHINSPGGEVYEGIAILNQLRQHPANVVVTVDALAASIASVIAVGCDEVVMAENSQMMIHEAAGICIGPASDMHSYGDLLDKVSDNAARLYAAKAGGDPAAFRDLMLAETWYDDAEAVTAGLADRVAGDELVPDDDITPENAFDLSIFRHQGRSDAPTPPLPAARVTTPAAALSAKQARRHRMIARRHALPL